MSLGLMGIVGIVCVGVLVVCLWVLCCWFVGRVVWVGGWLYK